jgi:hypothetical protein
MKRIHKVQLDKFYTKSEVVDKILTYLDLDEFDLIIEPSAGAGAFSEKLERYPHLFMDILPEGEGIIQQDWLEWKPVEAYKNILVVGNPPFGRQSSLAKKFIKKAALLGARKIAFILPKSFKKDSTQRSIPKNYHLELSIDLESDSFLVDGSSYDVPSVFQIWTLGQEERLSVTETRTSSLFTFTKKEDNPDFAVRRVGFYAGRPNWNFSELSKESHYFLKCSDQIDVQDLFTRISDLKWEHDNTSGPRSISKVELIKKINSL